MRQCLSQRVFMHVQNTTERPITTDKDPGKIDEGMWYVYATWGLI